MGSEGICRQKKPGPKNRSRLVLAGCPDKIVCTKLGLKPFFFLAADAALKGRSSTFYALRRGRIVKSRTWVKMLDICIPFSCETKGRSSAIN